MAGRTSAPAGVSAVLSSLNERDLQREILEALRVGGGQTRAQLAGRLRVAGFELDSAIEQLRENGLVAENAGAGYEDPTTWAGYVRLTDAGRAALE